MRNLLSSFTGWNRPEGTPAARATVVTTDAITKKSMNRGNARLRLKLCARGAFFSPAAPSAAAAEAGALARRRASASVMGMMARVRVSLTVTALSSVWEPRCHMLSHVAAAAVTEDVSFTAVPAKMPKGPPLVVLKPMALPSSGKRTAASTLKKKMTDMACATSSSSAPITGAVAAMADPPQMDEPTPTSVEMLDGMCSARWRPHAMARAVVMVHTMIGSDCAPVLTTTARSMPKPSSTTAAWSTYLDVHLMPRSAAPLRVQTSATTMPASIAKTAPPTTGTARPASHEGMAMARQASMPGRMPRTLCRFLCM